MKFHILNLENKLEEKVVTMPAGDNIVYWRWASPNIICLVTKKSVFYWLLDGPDGAPPLKIFDRHEDICGDGIQIIKYDVPPNGMWHLLVGYYTSENRAIGVMQLFSAESNTSVILHRHVGCFACVQLPGRMEPVAMLCQASMMPQEPAELVVIELRQDGCTRSDRYGVAQNIICSESPWAVNDFPISLHVNDRLNLIYMTTRFGYIFVFDICSGRVISRSHVVDGDPIFATCLDETSGGLFVLTSRHGQVLHMTLHSSQVGPFIKNVVKDDNLALTVATRMDQVGKSPLLLSNEVVKVRMPACLNILMRCSLLLDRCID